MQHTGTQIARLFQVVKHEAVYGCYLAEAATTLWEAGPSSCMRMRPFLQLTEAATARMFCCGRSRPVADSTASVSMPHLASFGSSLARSCH